MEARIPYPISFIKNFLLTLNRTKHSAEINGVSRCLINFHYGGKILPEYLNCIDFVSMLFRKRSTKVCLNLKEPLDIKVTLLVSILVELAETKYVCDAYWTEKQSKTPQQTF